MTYNGIVQQYSEYLISKYGLCTIVFDGYDNGPSIKDHEHMRKCKTTSAFVKIVPHALVVHKDQHILLSNEKNKSQFIHLFPTIFVSAVSVYFKVSGTQIA